MQYDVDCEHVSLRYCGSPFWDHAGFLPSRGPDEVTGDKQIRKHCVQHLGYWSVFAAGFGTFPPCVQRPAVMFMSCAVVVRAAISQREKPGRAVSHVISILDLAMLTIIGVGCSVFAPVFADIRENHLTLSSFDVWIASLAVGSIIVLGRRAWGWPITIVALVFLAFLVHGHLPPKSISHFEPKHPRIIETVWHSYGGIFGQVIGFAGRED